MDTHFTLNPRLERDEHFQAEPVPLATHGLDMQDGAMFWVSSFTFSYGSSTYPVLDADGARPE